MRIAVDVMGGDHAPDAILKGAIDALADLGAADELVLVGPRELIEDAIRERRVKDPRIVIEHAPDVIEMKDKPAQAVRAKPQSSIVRMAEIGAPGAARRCDVVLSAGNTGACVAAAVMYMRRMPGVQRPGIAVTIPAFSGPLVLCDAGANPEPLPAHLFQYGIMAGCYAEGVLGIRRPRVAVLNIGAEEGKGVDLVRGAHDLLKSSSELNYIGYIEGRDLFHGVADVVLTDGFVGNTMLKMAEGLATSLMKVIAQEVASRDPELILRLEPVIKSIYRKNDYHEYGGAPLLGINGTCMIAHGSSEARTIRAAIRNCRDFVASGVNEAIRARMSASALAGEERA